MFILIRIGYIMLSNECKFDLKYFFEGFGWYGFVGEENCLNLEFFIWSRLWGFDEGIFEWSNKMIWWDFVFNLLRFFVVWMVERWCY